jgi:hypothetical protein
MTILNLCGGFGSSGGVGSGLGGFGGLLASFSSSGFGSRLLSFRCSFGSGGSGGSSSLGLAGSSL